MKHTNINNIKRWLIRYRYAWIIVSYLIIFVSIICIDFHNISHMIYEYNIEQTQMVTSLLVNNVNSKLNNMIVQAEQAANIVLLNNSIGGEKLSDLKRFQEKYLFESVGFFDANNRFYSAPSEKTELIKHGFIQQAIKNEDTFITDPYRSSITGQYVITVFVPVYENEKRVATMYANIDLRQIASFADSTNVAFPVKICMFNSKSLNYIACNNMNNLLAGNWYSLTLMRDDMLFDSQDIYNKFLEDIVEGPDEGITFYSLGNRDFTLGYSSIDKMPNWYLALEIDNSDLSGTFTRFGNKISRYMILLLVITIIYAIGIIFMELLQRKIYQKISTEDTMTGVYNKKTFEYMVKEYIQSGNAKNLGTLVFVDVDDFKKYNDSYGHLNGDIVLKRIAGSLSDQFSRDGYVGRYGGDEFVVFVKGSYSRDEISDKFKTIRAQLSDIELDGFENVSVSFSAGASRCPEDATDYEGLCATADNALYQVKEDGKGKLYWYK